MTEGFLHPTTESSVTTKGYRVNSLRTSSWKPLELEGNLLGRCPNASLSVGFIYRHFLDPDTVANNQGELS
jgi:hypothetical protein